MYYSKKTTILFYAFLFVFILLENVGIILYFGNRNSVHELGSCISFSLKQRLYIYYAWNMELYMLQYLA